MVDRKGAFNIWKIIKGDFNKVKNNTIAWIVIIGLTIVPSLYAWFNIAASWDPYSNTGNLKVAVANEDAGYSGKLTSVSVNIGEKVISSLRENEALNWVFTDKEDAVQGVKDGSYYAALVIPESFSQDMMSFFTPDVHRSDLVYYLNEKENAIAPKITDKGASGVKNQIDEVFAKSITEIVLEIANTLSNLTEEGDADRYMNSFLNNFEQVGRNTSEDAKTLKSFAALAESLADVAATASELGGYAAANAGRSQELLGETSTEVKDTANELENLGRQITATLAEIGAEYDRVTAKIDEIEKNYNLSAAEIVSKLETVKTRLSDMTEALKTLRQQAQKLYEILPESQTQLRAKVQEVITSLDDIISTSEKVLTEIPKVESAVIQAEATAKEVRAICDGLRSEIDVVIAKYNTEVEPAIEALSASMIGTNSAFSEVFDRLDVLAAELEEDGKSAGESLRETAEAMEEAAQTMEAVGGEIEKTAKKLRAALNSGEVEEVRDLLGSNVSDISNFVSSPVELEKTVIYPVENYGSGMAPFYTVLSLWVGAIVLVAMLKVNLTEERKWQLEDLRDYQVYLGRMVFFLAMSLLQSGLVCLGDLFFLEIQCENPFLFLVAGWLTGMVFAIIMYTLTISFGDVGKAVAVILLVIQVAGSGGTFPIEMTPQFFQNMAALMPFTYAMTAMRECIGGFYGNTYWISLGYLGVYAAAFMLLGIFLRKPIIRLNDMIAEKLESTKLM